MAILDFLKSKKSKAPTQRKEKVVEKEKEPRRSVKTVGHREYKNPLILKRPLITERATVLAREGKYIFEVDPNANKKEIKKAIESVWPVEVEMVNIINLPPKKIRLGKSIGKRRKIKKAIVGLREGQSIELLPK